MERIVSLAKRRGFIYPSAEIYGGLSAVWDYGPLGVELINNIKQLWWQRFVHSREDVIGINSAVLTRREVLRASGHEEEFSDPLVDCKICKGRFRADEPIPKAKDHTHELTKPRQFNLMFKSYAGPAEDASSLVYLRPETAQGMFTNFKTIVDTQRVKLPFGIAQIGKSFRNEITTGDFTFRSREFEIAEVEYFVKPGTDEQWFKKWVAEWEKFFLDVGLKKSKLKLHRHPKASLAHYSKATTDIQYHFPFGWQELAGVANRTDYDLKRHQQYSGKDLSYFDEDTKQKYLPYVIEPTLGIERLMLALIVDAYDTISTPEVDKDTSGVQEYALRLNPKIAPIKVAVFPLVNKDKLPKIAKEIYDDLKTQWHVQYDDSGSIGRRYRRQDEIGTPFAITVDFDTLKDQTVTIRDRDSMKQDRVAIKELKDFLAKKI